MIERQNGVVDPEQDVGHAQVVLDGPRQSLDRPHHVVRQVADGAAGESRQVREAHRTVTRHDPAQGLERVAVALADRRPHETRGVPPEE